jgi:xanthine dehydrogenase accessory factor
MVLSEAIRLHDSGEAFCLAIVVAKSGSAPQVPGAKGLFLRDGRIIGTIGGGCLEMECRRLGLEALATGRHILREFKLDDDFGWDDGLICGGRVQVLLLPDSTKFVEAFRCASEANANGALEFDLLSGIAQFVNRDEAKSGATQLSIARRREVLDDDLFVEPILPPEKLVIFGGGHIGAQLARHGVQLQFNVTVVDDRPEFVSRERLPYVHNLVCENPEQFANQLHSDDDTYLCLVTRGHRNDAKVLRELIRKDRAYLGMIGSKRKREMVRKTMVDEGICTNEQFERVASPMGIDIGAETVEEIAVSIAAEWIKVRASKRGPILARCRQKAKV